MVEDVQNKMPNIQKFEVKTAILIDGAFYRERSKMIAGIKSPKEKATNTNIIIVPLGAVLRLSIWRK